MIIEFKDLLALKMDHDTLDKYKLLLEADYMTAIIYAKKYYQEKANSKI